MEKNTKTRIQHKHDSAENWNKAINFIPLIGELIVYDADENYSYPRFKVGDGETSVVNLAFANEQNLSTQVQSDWNQGDINQPDFIKNKPFGPKPDLYNNSNLGFELDSKSGIYFTNVGEDVIVPIQVNDSVTVIWDSIPYEVTSKEITFDLEEGAIAPSITVNGYLGDPKLLSDYFGGVNVESTGEPFFIIQKSGLILTFRGNNHSVIVKNNNYISKIDPQYLPDEALQSPVQADWNETDETSFAYIKNKPPISSEGISTIQSDWKQTDDTQPDFIKNKPTTWYASSIIDLAKVGETGEYLDLKHRPFGEIDFLEEQTQAFEEDAEDEIIYYYHKIYDNFSLVEGEQYRVTWDGSEYLCTCKRLYESTFLWLGNLAIFFTDAEDTGEPFLIAETSIVTNDTSEKHTFSVIPVNTIKKIDSKYLPDMDSNLPEITATDNGKVLGVVDGLPKWVEQSGNVSSDIVDIFSEQEIAITLQDEGSQSLGWRIVPAVFTLTVGETYYVVWDGVKYSCVAFSGSGDLSDLVFIGNTKFTDGTEGSGEPFAFAYASIEEDGMTVTMNGCMTDDTAETTHIVHIYQDKKTIDLPSDFFVPEEKLTDVLPKEDLDFTYSSSFDAYTALVFYNEEVYQKWNSYNGMVRVVWDNVEYDVPMQHAGVLSGVGDCTAFGGTGNGEPFAIGMIQEPNAEADSGYDYIMVIIEFTTEPSHNVQVSYIGEIPKINVDYLPPIEKEFLPDVTNEDNGKILTVSDGAWAVKQIQVEQVQADWDETDTTSPAYIKNKPVISGDGSASVQANWDQTDETQADFIKNKPFGSSGLESVVFLSQTDIPFTFDGSMHTVEAPATPELIELWDSNWISCDVTFDGTTYNCEPQSIQGAKAIGNVGALMGTGDNGMPFIFVIMNGYLMAGSLMDSPDTSETTHNISIVINRESIKYLDSKFIANVSWDKISEKPFDDIPAGTVVLEETVTMGSYMAETDIGFSILKNLQTLYIIDGAFYKVTIGENEYNAQANGTVIRYKENLDGVFALGVDGLPFFQNNPNYFPNGSTYDVKVVLAEDTVKKIDEKYLSDSLPEVTTTDNNKVLTVVNGVWTAKTPASGLPTVSTSDAGKFLRVNSSGVWVAEAISNAEEASF